MRCHFRASSRRRSIFSASVQFSHFLGPFHVPVMEPMALACSLLIGSDLCFNHFDSPVELSCSKVLAVCALGFWSPVMAKGAIPMVYEDASQIAHRSSTGVGSSSELRPGAQPSDCSAVSGSGVTV